MWRVRPARAADLPAIDALIASVEGDREALAASQFLVAQEDNGRIVGCVRLKPYADFYELASLVVETEWRASGVGRQLVARLLEQYQGTVYLICEDEVVGFFQRFGFARIPRQEMRPGLTAKWERYVAQIGYINIMRRD